MDRYVWIYLLYTVFCPKMLVPKSSFFSRFWMCFYWFSSPSGRRRPAPAQETSWAELNVGDWLRRHPWRVNHGESMGSELGEYYG